MVEEAPVLGGQHRIDQVLRHVLQLDVAAAQALFRDHLAVLGQDGDLGRLFVETGLQRVVGHQRIDGDGADQHDAAQIAAMVPQ